MAEFKDRLRQAMHDANLNQTELSKRTKIRQSSISDWLKGRYLAKQDKVEILARELNVSPSWLMGIDDNTPAPAHPVEIKPQPHVPETIAAHFEGTEFSQEAIDDIARFIEFVASKDQHS